MSFFQGTWILMTTRRTFPTASDHSVMLGFGGIALGQASVKASSIRTLF